MVLGLWREIFENGDQGSTQNCDARLVSIVVWPGEPFFENTFVKQLIMHFEIRFEKISNLRFKCQHTAIDPNPGPDLKCAPHHDSIKDSSIIKSYSPKIAVVDFQNPIF